MDLQLAGKRVFISGSTQGIGYAIAKACLAEGACVVINGRTSDRVAEAVVRLREETRVDADAVSGIAADFADAHQVTALIDSLGNVDVLVNSVGVFDIDDFFDAGDDAWYRYFEINVLSGLRLSRALMPAMLDRGWGRIIFVGTESAVDVPAAMIPYGASKSASLALSNGLAKLTRGTAVTVNTVLGGPTYSDGVARTVEQIAQAQSITADELKKSLVRDTSLIQRFIDPSEIASTVAFIASPRSSAMNGGAIRADGGVLTTVL
ncbi:SDR family NAD(P)-dependent oxidoreductase [Microbacterium sp. NPDC058342]|uniref:SDR family NAD(P)-dependent oxidoreductase n=1 Tax=Microbacterium sp. NPDC058342 TaxID=3346454 RepID=UPI003661EA7E